MKDALPIETRPPREQVIDILTTTLLDMLACGKIAPKRDDASDSVPATAPPDPNQCQ